MIKVTVTKGGYVKTVRFIDCADKAQAIAIVEMEYDKRTHNIRAEQV